MPVSKRTILAARKQRRLERQREYAKKGAAKYLERGGCRACGGAKEDQTLQHCNKCRRRVRSNTLKHIYGITVEEYEEIAAHQNHVCWICREEEKTKRRRLHVDHDHKTGEIRGLLCVKCNSGLGGFRDSPELLERAIEYLRVFNQLRSP